MENNTMLSDTPVQESHGGGYIALGFQGHTCFTWSHVLQQVVASSPHEFNAMRLKATYGAQFCNENFTVYPEKGEPYFDYQALADEVMQKCQEAGVYRESKQRVNGTWATQDGLVCNSGVAFNDKGEIVPRVSPDRSYLLPVGKSGLDLSPDDALAAPNEVLEFERAFDAWEWSTPDARRFVLGWVACGVYSGALTWRPHLYITGRAGAGKSTLARTLGALFGKGACRPTGQLTQAGILQKLEGRSIPCIIDETEAGKSNKSTLAALDVARWASSMTEDDDGVLRATSRGEAKGYRAFGPFAFLGINLPRLEQADQSRAVTLEMLSQRRDAVGGVPRLFLDERYCAAQGRKLRRLALSRWPTFQTALPLIRDAIMRKGGTAREADTMGSLLAGYWCLTSAAVPTAMDVSSLTAGVEFASKADMFAESDEARCLDVLLYGSVTVPVKERLGEFVRSMTVAEAVRHYCAQPEAQQRLERVLQTSGVRVLQEDGAWKLAVVSSPEHKELQRFYAGSVWKKGCWSAVLRRMPGGRKATQRIAGRSSKVTILNVPEDLLHDDSVSSSVAGEWRSAA